MPAVDYRQLAADIARQEAQRIKAYSHWSDWEYPSVALCGASIEHMPRDFSFEPTCPTCAVLKARADALRFE
jgi:hypothetical protein